MLVLVQQMRQRLAALGTKVLFSIFSRGCPKSIWQPLFITFISLILSLLKWKMHNNLGANGIFQIYNFDGNLKLI